MKFEICGMMFDFQEVFFRGKQARIQRKKESNAPPEVTNTKIYMCVNN